MKKRSLRALVGRAVAGGAATAALEGGVEEADEVELHIPDLDCFDVVLCTLAGGMAAAVAAGAGEDEEEAAEEEEEEEDDEAATAEDKTAASLVGGIVPLVDKGSGASTELGDAAAPPNAAATRNDRGLGSECANAVFEVDPSTPLALLPTPAVVVAAATVVLDSTCADGDGRGSGIRSLVETGKGRRFRLIRKSRKRSCFSMNFSSSWWWAAKPCGE